MRKRSIDEVVNNAVEDEIHFVCVESCNTLVTFSLLKHWREEVMKLETEHIQVML